MYAFTYNASCHSDGSGDTSHATSDLIDPIHPRWCRGTAAYAREKVEGYIQPSVPHQLRYDHIVRVYRVHSELFDGIVVMHTVINDEMMLHHLSSLLHILSHHHHHHNRFTSYQIIIFSSQLIKWSPPLYILSHHLSFTSYQIIIIASSLIRSSSSLHIMLHHHNRFASYQIITSALNLSYHLCFTSYQIFSTSLFIYLIIIIVSYHHHRFTTSRLYILLHDHLRFTSYHIISASHLITSSSPLHILSHQLCFTSYHIISASHLITSSLLHILSHHHHIIAHHHLRFTSDYINIMATSHLSIGYPFHHLLRIMT